MKPRIWTTIALFISSYLPLAFILIIKDIDVENYTLKNPYVSLGFFVIAVISAGVLCFSIKALSGGFIVKIKRVSSKSSELINYTIPYMISFFGFNLDKGQEVVIFIIFMALMWFLTVKTQNLFINPLLALLGYNLYDIEYEENSETRQAVFLSEFELKLDEQYQVQRLSKFLYFVTTNNPFGEDDD